MACELWVGRSSGFWKNAVLGTIVTSLCSASQDGGLAASLRIERLVLECNSERGSNGSPAGTIDGEDRTRAVPTHQQVLDPRCRERIRDREEVFDASLLWCEGVVQQCELPLAHDDVGAIELPQAGRGVHYAKTVMVVLRNRHPRAPDRRLTRASS